MLKKFTIYCAVIVSLLAVANRNGFVFASLFNHSEKADKAGNHYHK